MHRILRDHLGWSYRQESVLWPTASGWVPRLIFAKTSAEMTLGGVAREELLKDVENWTEASLVRAKAMTDTAFSGENPLSPLWLGRGGPMGTDLEDKCAWIGLNTMMFGTTIELSGVHSVIEPIKLDELKVAAKNLLELAGVSVIPGS